MGLELDFLRNELKILEALISNDQCRETNLARRLKNLKICKERVKSEICEEIANRLIKEKKDECDPNEIDYDCLLNIIQSFDNDLIRLVLAESIGLATGYVHIGAEFEFMSYEEYQKTPYAKEIRKLKLNSLVEMTSAYCRIPLSEFQQAKEELIRKFSNEEQKRVLEKLEREISELVIKSFRTREKIEEIKIKLRVGELLTQKKKDVLSFNQKIF